MSTNPAEMGVREQILAAAQKCLSQYGFAKTGVADVARESGFSRQTIHSHFGSRVELIEAALSEAGESFAERVEAFLSGLEGTPADLVSDAIAFVVAELPRDPLLRVIGAAAPNRTMLALGFDRAPFVRMIARRAIRPITSKCNDVTERQIDSLVEFMFSAMVYLLLSQPVFNRKPRELRKLMKQWITIGDWLK